MSIPPIPSRPLDQRQLRQQGALVGTNWLSGDDTTCYGLGHWRAANSGIVAFSTAVRHPFGGFASIKVTADADTKGVAIGWPNNDAFPTGWTVKAGRYYEATFAYFFPDPPHATITTFWQAQFTAAGDMAATNLQNYYYNGEVPNQNSWRWTTLLWVPAVDHPISDVLFGIQRISTGADTTARVIHIGNLQIREIDSSPAAGIRSVINPGYPGSPYLTADNGDLPELYLQAGDGPTDASLYMSHNEFLLNGVTWGLDVYRPHGSADTYSYFWNEHAAGDLANSGFEIDVGTDYVGLLISELDSSTTQIYATNSGAGYMTQLRNRGLRGWSVSDDGVVNGKITDSFQWALTVPGALTTGTDKAAHWQAPAKCRIDEVRCRVGTAPTGAPLIVDVNDDGATIFTTQANRPYVGVNVKSLTSGGDSTDATTYTTASVTLKAGWLYLLSFENSHASAAAAASSVGVTGPLGTISFTSRSSTTFNGGLNRVSIWSVVPSFNYTGPLFVTFGGAQTGATWSVDEVSGVDTSSNDGIVQQAVGTGNSTTPLATLAAFAAATNGAYAAHGQAAASATTPGTGWTELADATTATPAQAIETAFRMDNDTTADATITSAEWGSCAVELKGASSATSRDPDGGTAVAKDSVISVDIDQIGSTIAGSDLTVFIRGRYIW